jgi:hypothetical protein
VLGTFTEICWLYSVLDSLAKVCLKCDKSGRHATGNLRKFVSYIEFFFGENKKFQHEIGKKNQSTWCSYATCNSPKIVPLTRRLQENSGGEDSEEIIDHVNAIWRQINAICMLGN